MPPCLLTVVVTKEQEYFIDGGLDREGSRVKVAVFKLPSNSVKIHVKKAGKTDGFSQFIKRLGD